MAIEAYLGIVENGRVRLCDEVALKENTQVYVVVPETVIASPARIRSPRLADPQQAPLFAKQVVEAQPNAEL